MRLPELFRDQHEEVLYRINSLYTGQNHQSPLTSLCLETVFFPLSFHVYNDCITSLEHTRGMAINMGSDAPNLAKMIEQQPQGLARYFKFIERPPQCVGCCNALNM